jgi:hypothetical protein
MIELAFVMIITTYSSEHVIREAEVNFKTLELCERARITSGAWWTLSRPGLRHETQCIGRGQKI